MSLHGQRLLARLYDPIAAAGLRRELSRWRTVLGTVALYEARAV